MKNRRTSDWAAFSWVPEIHSMGVAIYDPIWSLRPHANRGTIELLHVLKGRLRLILPGRRLSAGPGDTLFVPSGVFHRDEFDLHRGLEIFMVHFRWKAEKDFFRRVKPELLLALPPTLKSEIGMLADRMRSDMTGEPEGGRMVAGGRLMTLLLLLIRFAESRRAGGLAQVHANIGGARRRLLMTLARQYLEQHYPEPVTLDHIARTLKVSPYYLSHVFSQQSDFSLFEYLTNLRLQKALRCGSYCAIRMPIGILIAQI